MGDGVGEGDGLGEGLGEGDGVGATATEPLGALASSPPQAAKTSADDKTKTLDIVCRLNSLFIILASPAHV